jgi:hypothetical protein
MRQFLQLNDFGIEIPGRQRIETYHPVYGNNADPYKDTRAGACSSSACLLATGDLRSTARLAYFFVMFIGLLFS